MPRRPRQSPSNIRKCVAWSCENRIPPGSRADRMFCSEQCNRKVGRARARAKQRVAEGKPPTKTDEMLYALGLEGDLEFDLSTHKKMSLGSGPRDKTSEASAHKLATANIGHELAQGEIPTTIGGQGFQHFVRSGWALDVVDRKYTAMEAANFFKVTGGAVNAWVNLYNSLIDAKDVAAAWADNDEVQALREYALSSFRAFTEVFFPDDLIPWFHEEWDAELTSALDEGERTVLLAPQRHGKTSFLVRQFLWRMNRNPNIRIGVVGKTADLAGKTTGVIRQYLENDPQFASVLLPPNTGYKPAARAGTPWTNSEFTLSTRTKVLKSPTMVALGIGGSIIGRDMDLIGIDDPVDRKSMLSPSEREAVWEWFTTDFQSRIEDGTGVLYIGSRQHKDDPPGRILKQNAEQAAAGHDTDWKVLLYRAHRKECSVPLEQHPEDPEDPGNKCILWPEFRTAKWLAKQRRGNIEHFSRNYLNSPEGDAFKPVQEDDILMSYAYDEWLSVNLGDNPMTRPRVLGERLPETLLVASVDPAVAKKNAATLWGYRTTPVSVPTDPYDITSKRVPVPVRGIVDFEEPPPGSPGIRSLLKDWKEKYGVTDWVFETNYFADQIANDTEINDIKARLGLKFHTHYTTPQNKHDERAGLLSMLSSLGARPCGFTLPGSTEDSRRRLSRLVNQALNYDPESTHYASGRRRDLDDDLLMSAWFGWYWIESRMRGRVEKATYTYGGGPGGFSPTHWSKPPWSM